MTVLDSGFCHYRQVMLLIIQEGQAGILLDEFIRREALFIFITTSIQGRAHAARLFYTLLQIV